MTGALLLIVIARPEQRRRFNLCFSDLDHRLVYTFDGDDAFDRFVEVRPDLVIAYENTPRLDGPLLCQLIRRQGGAEVPIVLLADEEVSSERLAETGADACLTWPFEAKDLLPLVDGLLSGPSSPPSAPPTLDLEPSDSMLSSVFLDDEDEALVLPIEEGGDSYPTSPGEEALSITDLLEEPLAPMGSGGISQDEVTNVQIDPQLLVLLEESEMAAHLQTQEDELPLVSPVTEDGLDTELELERVETEPPESLLGTTTETAKKRALLEEPPLPTADELGEFRREEGPEPEERPDDEALIAELPKEGTPTGGGLGPGTERKGAGRVGRGLDESQLGKRLIRRVREMHAKLGALDHHQVLGVEPQASRQAIDDAYFDLSIEFHPDRFFLLRAGDLKRQIFEIYQRLEEAYRVLSDPQPRQIHDVDRSGIDTTVDMPGEPEISTTDLEAAPDSGSIEELLARAVESSRPAAQSLIALARTALDDEDRNGARMYLTMALGVDPGNPGLQTLLQALVAKGAGLRPMPPIP